MKDLLLIKGLRLDLMGLKDKFPLKVMLGHHLLDLKDPLLDLKDHLLDLKDHLKALRGHLKDLKDHLKDLKDHLLLDSKDLQLDLKDPLKLDMRDHHQVMTDHHQDMKDHHQDMRGLMVMRDRLLLDMRDHLLDMMIDKDHSQHIHKFLQQTHIDCHKKVGHMREGHILHKHNEDSYLMILLVHKHKE